MDFPSWFKPLVWMWAVLGLLLGALAMWAAWIENTNEEIYSYSTGQVEWAEWLPLGVGGFLIAGAIPLVATAAVAWAGGLYRRRRATRRARH